VELMDPIKCLFFVAVAGFVTVAAVSDIRTHKLPNWLTVPALFAALVFHGITAGLSGLGLALGGFATGFGILFVLWLLKGMGGGDVKLMGALGAWLGPLPTLYVFVLSTFFAIFGSIGLFFYDLSTHGWRRVRQRFLPAAVTGYGSNAKSEAEAERIRQKRGLMPYALPVALSTWAVLAWHVIRVQS
jgi:prepilin peptidase CpaA